VKGVAVQDGKVLLLENERDEWELPGGKFELGEDPGDCVVREIGEETGCHVLSSGPSVVNHEHTRVGLFWPGELPGLAIPEGYKRSIATWLAQPGGNPASRRA
jgi:8-oxo-dGTP pyrophosphatase MutT (NUDIX family)